MKYKVDIKEINYGTIVVDAGSPEEALEIAEAKYSFGDTVWHSGEYEVSDARRLPDRSHDAR